MLGSQCSSKTRNGVTLFDNRVVFISIYSLKNVSLPSTGVPSLLANDQSRQMQILDRTVMLQALDLNHDSLIKLYALVQIGLINGLDIDVVTVSTCFNVCIPSVVDRATEDLRFGTTVQCNGRT